MAATERILLALLLLAPSAAAAETPCLALGAEHALSGRVETRDYPGPPNYRDIAAGDQKQTVFLLHLDAPLCTTARGEDAAARGVEALQLVFDWSSSESTATYQAVASGAGERFALEGELFRGSAREHRTPVLLLVARGGGE